MLLTARFEMIRVEEKGVGRAQWFRITQTAGTLSLVAGLAACQSPQARYGDALAGLSRVSIGQNAPEDAPFAIRSPAGFTTSGNTEQFLANAEKVEAGLRSFGPLTNTAASADQDPRSLVRSVTALLKERAPNIRLFEDLASARKARLKTTIVCDIQVQLGSASGQTTSVQISLIVLDEQQRPVSRLTGSGQATIPYPAFSYGFQEASGKALSILQQKLAVAAS